MLLQSALRRTFCGCIAAGALLTGCKEDSPDPPPQIQPGTRASAQPTAAASTTLNLRIHLTGLLMIVPPKPSTTGATHVLVRKHGGHSALFAFGYEQAHPPKQPDLCLDGAQAPPGAKAARMCYVDLDKWKVSPLGESPAATSYIDMEQFGAVNLTSGSGNTHKVDLSKIETLVHQDVLLNRGAPKEGCRLGTWKYDHVIHGQQDRELANVIPWDMTVPGGMRLVFTKKGSTVADTVPLVPDAGGTVELILANIPHPDVRHLPPSPGGNPTGPPPARATDLHHLYDLLLLPPSNPGTDPNRPLPHSGVANPTTAQCQVDITTKALRPAFSGPRTYACMPVSGELGP